LFIYYLNYFIYTAYIKQAVEKTRRPNFSSIHYPLRRPIKYLKPMFFPQSEKPHTRPPKRPNNGQNCCFLYFNLRVSRQEKGEEVF